MNGLYRRSPHLVSYWWQGKLVFENYARRCQVAASPLACQILHFFDCWRTVQALLRRYPEFSPVSLERAIQALTRANLLEHAQRAKNAPGDVLAQWKDWSPAASFLHFSTKDAHTPVEPDEGLRELRQRARHTPMPVSAKSYARAPQFPLPRPEYRGELPRVLLARRTWRQFSRDSVSVENLATLLGLSFGTHSRLYVPGLGRVALKTAPSGGACHPIEAYVVALRVKGVDPGLYHYAAGAHRLELLRRGASGKEVVRYLNGQWWFADAAAVILMTAVFARTQWKYPAARGYRIVLIDAGHVCQTFCLVATWLGLAPFCTMALADSRIEAALHLDGISESVLYAAGVGAPPEGVDWGPWPALIRGARREANSSFL